MTAFVGTIADGEEDDITLVALHILKVLNKNRLGAVIGLGFQFRFLGQLIGEDILDEVLLHLAERHDTDAQLRQFGVGQPSQCFLHDGLGFAAVTACLTHIIGAVDGDEAYLRQTVVDGGEGKEPSVVIL